MTDRNKSRPAAKPPAEDLSKPFLDLAGQRKEKWNEWRRAHKDVRVTFAGVDFSVAPNDKIDFSGFEFGDDTDFSRCKWRGGVQPRNHQAFTPGRAYFTGASFGEKANFSGAVFGNGADFARTTFGDGAVLVGAVFGLNALFLDAVFRGSANFTGAAFDGAANFPRATFVGQTFFGGAAFGGLSNFMSARFCGETRFIGAAFGTGALFSNAIFKGPAEFNGISVEEWEARPMKKTRVIETRFCPSTSN
jgi:uncharacterized protein YjbI with pentapeptide repeats